MFNDSVWLNGIFLICIIAPMFLVIFAWTNIACDRDDDSFGILEGYPKVQYTTLVLFIIGVAYFILFGFDSLINKNFDSSGTRLETEYSSLIFLVTVPMFSILFKIGSKVYNILVSIASCGALALIWYKTLDSDINIYFTVMLMINLLTIITIVVVRHLSDINIYFIGFVLYIALSLTSFILFSINVLGNAVSANDYLSNGIIIWYVISGLWTIVLFTIKFDLHFIKNMLQRIMYRK